MTILGIETSCDETAAAVVKKGTKILSNVVASSVELHQKTGGIIPEVAAREQIRCIMPVIEESFKVAKLQSFKKLDAIAVTIGPGLIGSLLVGVETAKTLSFAWQKPIVPINHLQAHLYANFIRGNPKHEIRNSNFGIPNFPAIGLVVSGGHTDLVLVKSHTCWHWLGGTRDDAAGECFDKCARVLGLDYPGGPAIATEAAKSEIRSTKSEIKLPRPMLKQNNFDFSFSGLKTAVINRVKEQENKRVKISKAAFATAVQAAIVEVLVAKTIRACQKYRVKSVLLGGGVAANELLRQQFYVKCQMSNVKFFVPAKNLCTDNAATIAARAYFACHPVAWQKITADPSLNIV